MAEYQIHRQLWLLSTFGDPGAVLVSQHDARALLDLVSAVRRLPDDGGTHGTIRAKEGLACDRCMVLWPCPTATIRDALARLDVEDRLDPITGEERG